jgi:hypothetical protein
VKHFDESVELVMRNVPTTHNRPHTVLQNRVRRNRPFLVGRSEFNISLSILLERSTIFGASLELYFRKRLQNWTCRKTEW